MSQLMLIQIDRRELVADIATPNLQCQGTTLKKVSLFPNNESAPLPREHSFDLTTQSCLG
jgi:hypothetical protein